MDVTVVRNVLPVMEVVNVKIVVVMQSVQNAKGKRAQNVKIAVATAIVPHVPTAMANALNVKA
jgi:hypothetical protein